MEVTWRVINRGMRGGKGTENKQHKWQVENRQGEGKNSIGNVEAKELICMTCGHELKGGNAGGRGCAGQREIKGGKWDNRNSIINKTYLRKKNTKDKRTQKTSLKKKPPLSRKEVVISTHLENLLNHTFHNIQTEVNLQCVLDHASFL